MYNNFKYPKTYAPRKRSTKKLRLPKLPKPYKVTKLHEYYSIKPIFMVQADYPNMAFFGWGTNNEEKLYRRKIKCMD